MDLKCSLQNVSILSRKEINTSFDQIVHKLKLNVKSLIVVLYILYVSAYQTNFQFKNTHSFDES